MLAELPIVRLIIEFCELHIESLPARGSWIELLHLHHRLSYELLIVLLLWIEANLIMHHNKLD